METKILSLEEKMIFKDLGIQKGTPAQPLLNGVVVIRDADTGEVLLTKKNLVVRAGRELALRQLFKMPYGTLSYENNIFLPSTGTETLAKLNERTVNLFAIGKGGAPTASPFSPDPVRPADNDIVAPVGFRNSTAATPLTAAEQKIYTDSRVSPVDPNTTVWYKKTFTKNEIILDDATDSYYVKLKLDITNTEARDTIVNELCLYSSRLINGAYLEPKIFSRITFPTEPLYATNSKALTIDYYIYA